MQCPSCHYENESTSTHCERCGTLLPNITSDSFPEQVAYQAPPPPPMNGHNPPLPPPSPTSDYETPPSPVEYEYEPPQISEYTSSISSNYERSRTSSMSTPLYSNQKQLSPHRLGAFSAILYFLGVIIVAFGIFAILVNFGSGATIGIIGILLSVGTVIVSIVLFVRLLQQHTSSLYWWQRLLWLVGFTVAAFVLLVITVLIFPSKTVTNFIMSCVFLLYGLAWCLTAIW